MNKIELRELNNAKKNISYSISNEINTIHSTFDELGKVPMSSFNHRIKKIKDQVISGLESLRERIKNELTFEEDLGAFSTGPIAYIERNPMKVRLTGDEDTAKNRFDEKIENAAIELLKETGMKATNIAINWQTAMLSRDDQITKSGKEKDVQVSSVESRFS
jgi:hypothetical protein